MSRRPELDGRADANDATVTGEFAHRDVMVGDVIAGRYRLDRMVGMGAMGYVFEAYDLQLDTTVAAKLLRAELSTEERALNRFRQELLVARKVSHPNVIRLHDMVQDQDRWVITMDFVEGQSLQDVIESEGKIAPQRAVEILRQLAAGLAAAHEVGVVHRDLKPGNVLINSDGNVLISDFGIARSMSHAGLTRDGMLVGTPDYLSPEQARGEQVDGRSDLYALGVILCEMLTGRLPFDAVTTQEAISARLARSPTPLHARRDGVPEWLVRVCHRLLRRNVLRRYQSAGELEADLIAQRASSAGFERPKKVAIAVVALVAIIAAAFGVREWTEDAVIEADSQPAAPPVAESPRLVILPTPLPTPRGGQVSGWTDAWLMGLLDAGDPDVRTVAPLAVQTAIQRLGLAPDRIPDHLPRIAGELGAHWLVLPQRDGATLALDIYEAPNGFGQPTRSITAREVVDMTTMRILAGELLQAVGDTTPQTAELPDFDLGAYDALFPALRNIEIGNPLAAVEPLQKITREHPEFYPAWWALSAAQEQLGLWDEVQNSAVRAGSAAAGKGRFSELSRAAQATALGNYDQAETILRTLVERFPYDASLAVRLAEYIGEGGALEQAIELLESTVERERNHPRAWFLLAKYEILSGNAKVAVDDYLVKALVIQNRLANPQGRADIANAMGVGFEHLGDLDQAASHYQQAAALRAEIGDHRGQATTLRNLAGIDGVRGRFEQAESHLDQAAVLLNRLGDLDGLAAVYNDRGILAEDRGDHRRALEAYENALRLRRQLPDERDLAESLYNVGSAHFQLGAYDNSRAYLSQARTIFERANSVAGQVHTSQQLAMLDYVGGDFRASLARLEQTRIDAEGGHMEHELGVSLGLMAEVQFAAGRFSEALDLSRIARESFAQRGEQRGTLEMAILGARIRLALGDLDGAAESLDPNLIEGGSVEQRAAASLVLAALEHGRSGSYPTSQITDARELALASGSAMLDLASAWLEARASSEPDWSALWDRATQLGHVPMQLIVGETAARQSANEAEATAITSRLARIAAGVQPSHRRARALSTFLNARCPQLAVACPALPTPPDLDQLDGDLRSLAESTLASDQPPSIF